MESKQHSNFLVLEGKFLRTDYDPNVVNDTCQSSFFFNLHFPKNPVNNSAYDELNQILAKIKKHNDSD